MSICLHAVLQVCKLFPLRVEFKTKALMFH